MLPHGRMALDIAATVSFIPLVPRLGYNRIQSWDDGQAGPCMLICRVRGYCYFHQCTRGARWRCMVSLVVLWKISFVIEHHCLHMPNLPPIMGVCPLLLQCTAMFSNHDGLCSTQPCIIHWTVCSRFASVYFKNYLVINEI